MRQNRIMYSIYEQTPGLAVAAASVTAYEAACRQRCAIHATDAPSTQLLTKEMGHSLDSLFGPLGAKEQDMLRRHCGMWGAPESYNDIAKSYNVSKQRVYEIIQGALKKVRNRIKKRYNEI